MKQKYVLASLGEHKNSLEQLVRKDGKESKTYIVKTSSPSMKKGRLESGEEFIELAGGPRIVVKRPLKEVENMTVQSIDYSEVFGYTVTFV